VRAGDVNLKVSRFVTSPPFETNTYVLEVLGEMLVVDPGEGISRFVNGPAFVLVTHGHCDHISGVPELKVKKLFVSKEDSHMLSNPKANLSADFMDWNVVLDLPFEEIEKFFNVLAVPGHTRGSRFVVFEGVVFTGDTMFADTIGRVDLSGSEEEMKRTLEKVRRFFSEIPKDWLVCPGHGEVVTVGELLKKNPFFHE